MFGIPGNTGEAVFTGVGATLVAPQRKFELMKTFAVASLVSLVLCQFLAVLIEAPSIYPHQHLSCSDPSLHAPFLSAWFSHFLIFSFSFSFSHFIFVFVFIFVSFLFCHSHLHCSCHRSVRAKIESILLVLAFPPPTPLRLGGS